MWYWAGWLILSAAPVCAAGIEQNEKKGAVEARARLDRDAMELSDEIGLTLIVEGPTPLEVEPIKSVTQSKAWLVVSSTKAELVPVAKGRMRWQQSFRLTPLGEKELSFPLEPIRVRAGGDDVVAIGWKPFTVKVSTVVANPTLGGMKDTLPPIGVADPESLPWWLIGAGVGLAVAGVATIVVVRRRARRPAPPPVDLPPAEWALKELERLEASVPTALSQVERYHTMLSNVVRHYLDRRFGLHSSEQTTRELLGILQQSTQLAGPQQEQLGAFFDRCDLAKYARAAYSAEECRAAIQMAREFVQQTAVPVANAGNDIADKQLSAPLAN
jgi:hypothetical protein